MLSLKTTIAALIAAISVIATASVVPALIPQAFAQFNNTGDVSSSQNVNIQKEVNQNIEQNAASSAIADGDYSSNEADSQTNQQASQGFCEQIAVSQATAGNVAGTNTVQKDTGEVDNQDGSIDDSDVTGKDCS